MKITSSQTNLGELDEDVLVVPVFEGDSPNEGALAAIDHLTAGAVASVFERGEMEGKRDSSSLLQSSGTLPSRRVLLYGAGRREDTSALSVQRLSGTALRALSSRKARSVAFLLRDWMQSEAGVRAVVEGAMLGVVETNLYGARTSAPAEIETLHLVAESAPAHDIEEAIATATITADATNFARLLGNEPGNIMTPVVLAARAEEMARREGLSIEILDEKQMKELGMGALLAVSRGSEEPARLIILNYVPEGGQGAKPGGDLLALIGKGITFDSGGISIKPADSMDEMKFDMGGGAAVLGAMQAIARLKPPIPVMGLVPAAENMPSGRAVKPGDVVRSLSGKTIEVINTDAEGRLILADAITYAINKGATTLVDAATLTGACVIALGDVRAGIIGSNQELMDALMEAGETCGERLWQLPADSEYNSSIRSDIADIKNVGDRTAGAITAAMFLKHFSGAVPWAHLDIAGTAWIDRSKPYMAKGATGFGVRLFTTFVMNRAGKPA
ncbi:MAG TPA: leucyl aminopeptidase [Blastocatellia bacterium]|jgi:leucyl aminopeptidase|nr:leucyl aminopeptidase [Blastocatellia bacterium]